MKKNLQILLALLFWSAIFICGGCKGKTGDKDGADTLKVTMKSYNMTITQYKDGKMSYRFKTPYVVRYEGKGRKGADTAYMLFDKGVDVVTFVDSTDTVESHIVSKWALFKETEEIWEARDSVVAQSKDGKVLYTDLLFWNQREGKIYSPIETKVVSGDETVIGRNGFESDESMENIVFRRSQGRFLVDTVSNAN